MPRSPAAKRSSTRTRQLAPRSAAALDRPVGQSLSNLRRPGALADHPEWETALKEVDEDWNPAWPAEWQRHFAAVREMLVEESVLAYVEPGVTVHGMDIGKWLEKQRQHAVWTGLMDGQRERLEQLGVMPTHPEQETSAKPSKGGLGAFERGVEALSVQGAHGLCDGSQGPRRAAGGRDGGDTRGVSVEHEVEARQAHRRQAPPDQPSSARNWPQGRAL
nr:helicase associated domain-containing protein [Streptomyces sp. ISL-98]